MGVATNGDCSGRTLRASSAVRVFASMGRSVNDRLRPSQRPDALGSPVPREHVGRTERVVPTHGPVDSLTRTARAARSRAWSADRIEET